MTKKLTECRPHGQTEYLTDFKTVKEIAKMYHVSTWTIYNLIKSDPTFPYINVGLRKRLVISNAKFEAWLVTRRQSEKAQNFDVQTGAQLFKAERPFA